MKNVFKAALLVAVFGLASCADTRNYEAMASNLDPVMDCNQVMNVMGKPDRVERVDGFNYWVWFSMVSFDGGITYVDVEELAPHRVIGKFDGCKLIDWKGAGKATIKYGPFGGVHNKSGDAAKAFNE